METRIQKYKNYRAELIKQGAITVDMNDKPRTTTTALPLKEVMEEAGEEDPRNNYYRKLQRIRIIQISLLSLILISAIIGLIFFGIFAFNGGK